MKSYCAKISHDCATNFAPNGGTRNSRTSKSKLAQLPMQRALARSKPWGGTLRLLLRREARRRGSRQTSRRPFRAHVWLPIGSSPPPKHSPRTSSRALMRPAARPPISPTIAPFRFRQDPSRPERGGMLSSSPPWRSRGKAADSGALPEGSSDHLLKTPIKTRSPASCHGAATRRLCPVRIAPQSAPSPERRRLLKHVGCSMMMARVEGSSRELCRACAIPLISLFTVRALVSTGFALEAKTAGWRRGAAKEVSVLQ